MRIVRRQVPIVLPQKEIADLRLRIKLCRPPTRPEITPCPLQERVRLPKAEVIPAQQRDDTDTALRVHAGPYPFMRTERHHGIEFLKRAGKLATIDPELMVAGHEQDSAKRDFSARNVEPSRRKSSVTSPASSSTSCRYLSRDRLSIQSRFSR